MVGRLLSFWDGIFSRAMLNFQGGYPEHPGRTMIHIAGNFHLLRIGILNAPECGGDGATRWVPENKFLNGGKNNPRNLTANAPEKLPFAPIGKDIVFQSHHFLGSCGFQLRGVTPISRVK